MNFDPENLELFPLHTVLFPGGQISLRVFEPRYTDMVGRCVKHSRPFGICLISEGNEAGSPATPHNIGTLANITDWDLLDNGMLGVMCEGFQRFRLTSLKYSPDNLARGSIVLLESNPDMPIPARHRAIIDIAKNLLRESGKSNPADLGIECAESVGFRLAELLPWEPLFQQELLEIGDPIERLDRIRDVLDMSDMPGGA